MNVVVGGRMTMAKPVLMAIDEEAAALELVVGELRKRYGEDYEVVAVGSVEAADHALVQMKRDGRQIAAVLADVRMSAPARAELFSRARELHPGAKRGLRLTWGDRAAGDAVCTRQPSGRSTSGPPNRGGRPMRSSTDRSAKHSESGREPPFRRSSWSASSVSDGPHARTRSATCSAAIASRTASTSPTPTRARRCWRSRKSNRRPSPC